MLQQSPAIYKQIEGAHLETMQADFSRIIWIDGSAAALTTLEMHNRDRSSAYLNALNAPHDCGAHATLQVARDLKSWSPDYQAAF